MALAVALLATVFYKLNVCDMKKKGRGQRICTPVSQWFHTFLASGKCPSSHGGHRFPQNRSTLSRLVAMLDAFLFWKTEYEFRNGLMTSFSPSQKAVGG